MKYSFIDILAGILSAIIASMGLGGGGVYIMYLTLLKDTPQINAQGLNLLFFIPCAAVSLIIYIKNKMIKPKAVIPMALGGGVGAVTRSFQKQKRQNKLLLLSNKYDKIIIYLL